MNTTVSVVVVSCNECVAIVFTMLNRVFVVVCVCVCVCVSVHQWYETKQQTDECVFKAIPLSLFILTPSSLSLSAGSLCGFRSMNQCSRPLKLLAFHKQAEGNNSETEKAFKPQQMNKR